MNLDSSKPNPPGSFREKFGRDPGPNDPIFFDPDADTPQPMSEEQAKQIMVEAATAAGIPPRLIYAMNKTGLIVSEDNRAKHSAARLRAWDDACREYDEKGEKTDDLKGEMEP